MTPNKVTNLKNIELLKKELDIMHKLFDNLKSKNKKSMEQKVLLKEESQEAKIDDSTIFDTPKLPEKKLETKQDNLVNASEEKPKEPEESLDSNDSLITIEFDNEELKSIQNKTITSEKIVSKKTIEPNTSEDSKINKTSTIEKREVFTDKKDIVSKKVTPTKSVIEVKKETLQKVEKTNTKKELTVEQKRTQSVTTKNTVPKITVPTVKKEDSSTNTTKPQTQVVNEEKKQESYLSIKEKLEKIKADIKKRELLREQKLQITTTVTKIVEKNKANSEKLKVSTTSNSQTNKFLDLKKTEPKTDTFQTTNNSTKNIDVKSPTQKFSNPKIAINSEKKIGKVTEIKKSENNNPNNKFSKIKEIKPKNTTIKNKNTKQNTDIKPKNNKLDVLSISILILIIIALLVFWYLYIS